MLYKMFYKKNHIWVLFLVVILAFVLLYYFLGNVFSVKEGFPKIGKIPKSKTTGENVAYGLAAAASGLAAIATLGQSKELNDATRNLAKKASPAKTQEKPTEQEKPRSSSGRRRNPGSSKGRRRNPGSSNTASGGSSNTGSSDSSDTGSSDSSDTGSSDSSDTGSSEYDDTGSSEYDDTGPSEYDDSFAVRSPQYGDLEFQYMMNRPRVR